MSRPAPLSLQSLASPAQLRALFERHAVDIPVDADTSLLAQPVRIADRRAPNRFCLHPMEGQDALADGSPGPLTLRRYTRYARGGAGLIWLEATAVVADARSSAAQLYLHRRNVDRFSALVRTLRQAAAAARGHEILLILQLAHAGRRALVPRSATRKDAAGTPDRTVIADAELDRLRAAYLAAARLARDAGFDGVDVKSCHDDLAADLLAAFERDGAYGGSFAGRTAFLREIVAQIRAAVPELLPATRMTIYDARPAAHGFGVAPGTRCAPDLREPIRLAQELFAAGLALLSLTTRLPALRTDVGAGPDLAAASIPEADALARVALEIELTGDVQAACPDQPIVGGGYSGFRQFAPLVAAGVLRRKGAALAGFGRALLACPDMPRTVIAGGEPAPEACCIACAACTQLLRDGGPTGCVIRDREVYGPQYRRYRSAATDRLVSEAGRCHQCDAAPCSRHCPTGIDVPAFLRAFEDGDLTQAYRVLRAANVLPELCAYLCPAADLCEGACIEQVLGANPIPIRDIQRTVCRAATPEAYAAARYAIGARTGKSIAVIGGGPAGLAAAVRLAEHGHQVRLLERETVLGGMPELVIPSTRYPGAAREIERLLRPALEAGRLELRLGVEVSGAAAFEDVRRETDAVLLATGLWRELSLGPAAGAIDALGFLQQVKRGTWTRQPERVAVLAGGDSAMDATVAAAALQPKDVYVVYGGTRADLHWHLPDDWLRAQRVHALLLLDPLGYSVGPDGRLTGLKVCRTVYGAPDAQGRRWPEHVPGGEDVLQVDLVIEAMGLGVAADLPAALPGLTLSAHGLVETVHEGSFATRHAQVYAAGALINGGASVCQCIAEGRRAADEIDRALQPQTKGMP